MKTNFSLCAAGLLAVSAVWADTGDGYREAMSSNQTDGFYNPARWQGEVLSADYDYRIGYWWGMSPKPASGSTTADAPHSFPGNSLTIGNTGRTSGDLGRERGWAKFKLNTEYTEFPRDGLIVRWGVIGPAASKKTYHLLGRLTTTSSTRTHDYNVNHGAGIDAYYSDSELVVDAKMVSAADKILYLGTYDSTSKIRLNGDMSEYAGELFAVGRGSVITSFAEMPGTLFITNGYLRASTCTNVTTLGTLKVGGEIQLKLDVDPATGTNSQFRLTTGFEAVDGHKLHIRASHFYVQTNSVPWVTGSDDFYAPVLTAPVNSLDIDDFVFDGFDWTSGYKLSDPSKIDEAGIFYSGLHVGRLEIKPNSDNETETLYLVHEPIVYMIKSDSSTDQEQYVHDPEAAFDPTAWTDGQVVHAGVNYLVKWCTGALMPSGSSFTPTFATPWNERDYVFPGRSLTVRNLQVNSEGEVTIGRLRCIAEGEILFGREGQTLKGTLEFCDTNKGLVGTGAFVLGRHRHVVLASRLSGRSRVSVFCKASGNWGSAKEIDGELELVGDNSDFTGTFCITNRPQGASTSGNTRLYLNGSRNLGGPLAAFNYRALELSRGSAVYPKVSMELSDPTHGVFVLGSGEFNVPAGVTLTVPAPVTFDGSLAKTGDGILRLGAKSRFTDGGAETLPTAGNNVLLVNAGYVSAGDPEAFKGLSITVADTAGLAFSAQPTGALATDGVRLADTEFTGSGKIAIALDPATVGDDDVTVPLFTGTRAQVDAMVARCHFVKTAAGARPRLVYVGDANSTTVSGAYAKYGIVLIVR